MFRRPGNPKWLRTTAGYTAHHVIALAFMVIATIAGFAGWFAPTAATASAWSRLLVADGTARWLGAMLFGELVLWDFPCSLFIAKLREPVMLAHHVGLLATAFLALKLPLFYGTFYLGWAELSNIPLQIWDTSKDLVTAAEETDGSPPTRARLEALRDASYAVFCAAFLVVRVVGCVPQLSSQDLCGAMALPTLSFLLLLTHSGGRGSRLPPDQLHRDHHGRPAARHSPCAADRWRVERHPSGLPGAWRRVQCAHALLVCGRCARCSREAGARVMDGGQHGTTLAGSLSLERWSVTTPPRHTRDRVATDTRTRDSQHSGPSPGAYLRCFPRVEPVFPEDSARMSARIQI